MPGLPEVGLPEPLNDQHPDDNRPNSAFMRDLHKLASSPPSPDNGDYQEALEWGYPASPGETESDPEDSPGAETQQIEVFRGTRSPSTALSEEAYSDSDIASTIEHDGPSETPSNDIEQDQRTSLLQLPTELLSLIFLQLRPIDALKWSLTSKTLHELTTVNDYSLIKAYLRHRGGTVSAAVSRRGAHFVFLWEVSRHTCDEVNAWHGWATVEGYDRDNSALCESCEDEILAEKGSRGELLPAERQALIDRSLAREGLTNYCDDDALYSDYIEGVYPNLEDVLGLM